MLVALSVLVLSWGLWETVGSAIFSKFSAQDRIEEFAELQSGVDPLWGSQVGGPGEETGSTERPGRVVGRLRIPALDVDEIVVWGTALSLLRSGPGLWESGVVPGEVGNATIAGHRTTYGATFRHLDRLTPGDRITFEVPGQPLAVFEVRGSEVVSPTDVGVTAQGPGVRLTLTTCHPVGSDAERYVVQAELVEGRNTGSTLSQDQWSFRR